MADAYNWAKMCTAKEGFLDNQDMIANGGIQKLRNLYKSIWEACVGPEGFEEFFKKCESGEIKVNGATFMNEVKKRMGITKNTWRMYEWYWCS